jgi:hypothetical protein
VRSEEDERLYGVEWEEGESAFGWEGRVMAVAAFWTFPGLVFGALVRLCVPGGGPAWWWVVCGGILGATVGGLLEADHWS